jgi:hypothetical protein
MNMGHAHDMEVSYEWNFEVDIWSSLMLGPIRSSSKINCETQMDFG